MSTITRMWHFTGPLIFASVYHVSHNIWKTDHDLTSNMEQESAPIKTFTNKNTKSDVNTQIPLTRSTLHVSETQIQPYTPDTEQSRSI